MIIAFLGSSITQCTPHKMAGSPASVCSSALRTDKTDSFCLGMSQGTIVICRLTTESAQIAKITGNDQEVRRPSDARCCSKGQQKLGVPCQWNAGRQDQPESQHRCRRSCPGPGVHQRHASDLQHCHPHSTPSRSTRLHYHASCPASGTLVKQSCLLIEGYNCC